MSDNPSLLKFTTSELTDVHTEIYQLDNGKKMQISVLYWGHIIFRIHFLLLQRLAGAAAIVREMVVSCVYSLA